MFGELLVYCAIATCTANDVAPEVAVKWLD